MKSRGIAINKDPFCYVVVNSLHFVTGAFCIHLLSKKLVSIDEAFL